MDNIRLANPPTFKTPKQSKTNTRKRTQTNKQNNQLPLPPPPLIPTIISPSEAYPEMVDELLHQRHSYFVLLPRCPKADCRQRLFDPVTQKISASCEVDSLCRQMTKKQTRHHLNKTFAHVKMGHHNVQRGPGKAWILPQRYS